MILKTGFDAFQQCDWQACTDNLEGRLPSPCKWCIFRKKWIFGFKLWQNSLILDFYSQPLKSVPVVLFLWTLVNPPPYWLSIDYLLTIVKKPRCTKSLGPNQPQNLKLRHCIWHQGSSFLMLSYPGLFKNIPHVWFLRLYSLIRNPQHDFPKMRGVEGLTAVWNFSENSSVLVGTSFPYSGSDKVACKEVRGQLKNSRNISREPKSGDHL